MASRAKTVLAIVGVVVFLAGFAWGYVAHRNDIFPARVVRGLVQAVEGSDREEPPGRWREAAIEESGLTERQLDEMEKLRSIGYLSGSAPASGVSGVTVGAGGAAYRGWNFYTSGHAPEAILMDMDGAELHRWGFPFADLPGPVPAGAGDNVEFWRRAYLFENGDVLAIYEGYRLIKLDRDSNLLWVYPAGGDPGAQGDVYGPHHDLSVEADGSIYVLTRKPRMVPWLDAERPVLEDFVTVLTPDGAATKSVSLLEAFARSSYASSLSRMLKHGDVFHTNTLEVFDGSHADHSPIFKKGNVLVSILRLNLIAIVDMAAEQVVWVSSGMWLKQHQPTLLPNGNMLLFDNLGHHGKSKVIEFEPLTQQIVWAYADGASSPLFSETCGSNQRLPNGDTLITETDNGRALEIDPDGKIVWEFLNPHRAGADDELIASLFEVVRLPPDFPLDWLD